MAKYKLILDNREHGLIELLKEESIGNFDFEIAQLPLGDIVIKSVEDDQTIIIFERKTCTDLLSSINDGRYRDQKTRLIANYSLDQICYIIEANISNSLDKYRKNGKKIVIGALVNKLFRDKIKILRTSTINETCDFILNICKKINSNPEFFIKSSNDLQKTLNNENKNETSLSNSLSTNEYLSNIKVAKKDNIDGNAVSVLSLTIIPGVSHKVANLIISKVESLNKLIVMINNDREETIKTIQNLEMDVASGKKRKIGSKVATRIVEFLS
jgi:ERCC4-type nuclease